MTDLKAQLSDVLYDAGIRSPVLLDRIWPLIQSALSALTAQASDASDVKLLRSYLYEAPSGAPGAEEALQRLAAKAPTWQPMETAPPRDVELAWWVVPKTNDETYTDTSGRPITSRVAPHRVIGKYGYWSALQKAIAWHTLPLPPSEATS